MGTKHVVACLLKTRLFGAAWLEVDAWAGRDRAGKGVRGGSPVRAACASVTRGTFSLLVSLLPCWILRRCVRRPLCEGAEKESPLGDRQMR